MIRFTPRTFKVTVSHTGGGGTSYVLNHGFGNRDVNVEVRYNSTTQNYSKQVDYFVSSGNVVGYDLIQCTTENCTVRLYRWQTGTATGTIDADIIVRESI